MNKVILCLMTSALGFSMANAQAGLVDISAGVNAWFVDAKGYTEKDNVFELRQNFDNKFAFGAWLNIEHPLPLVPNLGVRYGSFDHTDNGIKADMSYGDIIGYYNFLDITPLKLDGGIGFRFEDFAYDHTAGDASYNRVLPYLFGHGSLDIIGTGLVLDAEAMGSEMPFHDHTKFLDAKLGVDYHLGGTFIDWSLGGGYRYMYLTQDTSDYKGLTTIIKGPYVGISGFF